ncbi:uncharacterized protein LOC127642323 isoform X2 [Xyrauchen texanus]|nr:uncharacterized protein LOC127642323 isoform X2 [Xyrauchen texanus]XP_051980905.1 uncharacterized protein LOC127642323 isoform X2 [Xyrauchen texanus]
MKHKLARLQTSDGKFVCIQQRRKPTSSYQMVTGDLQVSVNKNAGKVTVYDVEEDNNKCMAFCFEVKKKAVFPVVPKKDCPCENLDFKILTKKEESTAFTLDKTFLFQWGEEEGQWRSLKSIAEPSKYLIINGSKVTISPQCFPHFQIANLEPRNPIGKRRRLRNSFAAKRELNLSSKGS